MRGKRTERIKEDLDAQFQLIRFLRTKFQPRDLLDIAEEFGETIGEVTLAEQVSRLSHADGVSTLVKLAVQKDAILYFLAVTESVRPDLQKELAAFRPPVTPPAESPKILPEQGTREKMSEEPLFILDKFLETLGPSLTPKHLPEARELSKAELAQERLVQEDNNRQVRSARVRLLEDYKSKIQHWLDTEDLLDISLTDPLRAEACRLTLDTLPLLTRTGKGELLLFLDENALLPTFYPIIDLTGADARYAILDKADLSILYLSGIYLTGASLEGAQLNSSDLTWATLSDAILDGANLSKSDLREANLYKASLVGADLKAAKLRRADLTSAFLTRATLTRADLRGANLHKAILAEANLSYADLTGADLSEADLKGADLTGADLSKADLTGADLSNAILNEVDFLDAKITEGQVLRGKHIIIRNSPF